MLDQKLFTLIAVAEEKNFTKAAEKLSLTQPVWVRHILSFNNLIASEYFIEFTSNVLYVVIISLFYHFVH